MKQYVSSTVERLSIDVNAIAGLIANTQLPGGEIPWSPNDKTDPWDHVESAMGLVTGGFWQEARRAFDWMAGTQLENGSWYSAYRKGLAGRQNAGLQPVFLYRCRPVSLLSGDKRYGVFTQPLARGAIGHRFCSQPSGPWRRNLLGCQSGRPFGPHGASDRFQFRVYEHQMRA